VADPGCLSRIPDPDFYPSRIPNLGSRIQKQFVVITFYVATNFTKLFSFEVLKKKFWANFQRIVELFLPKKLSISSQKYGFGIRDPGSGKNLFRIPDPGVKKAPDPGSGSATLLASTGQYIYCIGSCRLADPDPYPRGSALLLEAGSGSAF
jgi:hypothetical protein